MQIEDDVEEHDSAGESEVKASFGLAPRKAIVVIDGPTRELCAMRKPL